MRPLTYDPAIPSDGLTVDTDCGPADTVALERVRRGIRCPLTFAERQLLNAEIEYDLDAELMLADGLGVSHDSVRRLIARARGRRRAAHHQPTK